MKLALGTVQFGVDYGISNKGGKTSQDEVGAILAAAERVGVRVIDTAALYGDSETVLGRSLPPEAAFDIVTKTPVFPKQRLEDVDAQLLEDTLRASLAKLGRTSVYGLLMHRAEDILMPGGDLLFARLLSLRHNGLVGKIGVSVYSGRQIDQVLERFSLDLIQLPLNVLDQRLLRSGHLQKLKAVGVEIHARSAFLQGLLLMARHEVPDYFMPVRQLLDSYRAFAREQGLTPLQAALAFVSNIQEIDQVICGVNNAGQFHELCDAAQIEVDFRKFADFATADEAMVNPAMWRLEKGKK